MRDPHIVSLRYRLEPVDSVTFDDPQPIERKTDAFRMRLEDGTLSIDMVEHFASVEDARRVVNSFLRAWEIDAALRYGRREIAFVFEDAEVIDRDPPPPGSPQVIGLAPLGILAAVGSVTAHVRRRKYPEPPTQFRASPDVETLWWRYEGYLQGREPLLPMAFFCLSMLEASAGVKKGKRQQTARKYQISEDVLSKLGELTSLRGDEKTARKFDHNSTRSPLTSAEVTWIESAVKAIIRRLGEYGSTTSLSTITMNDLPEL